MKDDEQGIDLDKNRLEGRQDETKKLPSPIQPSLLYMTASLPQPLQYFPKLNQLPTDARLRSIISSKEPGTPMFLQQRNGKEDNIISKNSIPLLLDNSNQDREDNNRAKNGRRYHCSICQKKFMRPSSLKIHIYSHTGEKPYRCTFPGCERRFSVHSNMKRHLRVHPTCSSFSV